MKIVRKGCANCGRYVMALDSERSAVRIAIRRFTNNPTTANRRKAEAARASLEQAKRAHDQHMEETCGKI